GLVSLGDNLNVSGTATPGAFKMTAGAGAGKVLTSDASGNGSWIAPVVQGGMINGKLATSVASNNFTLAIKTLAGNDPSVTDPVYVRIGNTLRAITAALSVTKNAGTNWMNLGSNELKTQDIDLFTYLGYNATDGVVIGFSPIPYARVYGDFSTTSTSETYAAISTITHATSTDEYENVGRFNVTLSGASAYNWSIPSTSIIINHPIDSTRLLVYVPRITAFSGSFTTISSLLAQFRRQGKQISLAVQFTVTTVGTASGETLVTTPYQTAATYVGSGLNSAAVSMLVYFTAPAQLAVRKYDSTFGVTSGTSLYLTCIYIGN
ncbi:MAG TPA: hypothetical protein VKQ72_05370, partial [Aggregatilineales bacterium]|nr:hypothetical protein [Aggregatilineales bacterium]